MASAAHLVCRARDEAGLSIRAVAARAGVPASTVSRIERGEMDPTLTMLRRVMAGASKRLILDDGPLGRPPSLATLADGANLPNDRFRVDWTALRGFADWIRRHPDRLCAAVEDPPARTGTPLDAILAAFAEELCERYAIATPRWTADVPALDQPWEPDGTARMLREARQHTPPSFQARNLVVRRRDIFRED